MTEIVEVTVEIPAGLRHAIDAVVAQALEAELGDRELILAPDAFAAAEADIARWGVQLLKDVVDICYPGNGPAGRVTLEFGRQADTARLGAALAFGAVTARFLTTTSSDAEQSQGPVELLGAVFNLGVGLIDGICDWDAAYGIALLELVKARNLAEAAEAPRARGWLRGALPAVLAHDPAAAFAADVVEAFFATLHVVFPGDARLPLRRRVAAQLGAALAAEQRSVGGLASSASREQLLECSRLTSVLPFQIIETLALGDQMISEPTAATQLGEAMWRIDDLVDLCDDAQSGALNGVLLAAMTGNGRPSGRDRLAGLERLLASTSLRSTTAQAAASLLAGLQRVGGSHGRPVSQPPATHFLYFIQRYAGIGPRAAS